MLTEQGVLNYAEHGVSCSFEIRDEFCVSEGRANELIGEIEERTYPYLLEKYKRKEYK